MSPQAQGINALFGLQYEEAYGVSPSTPDLTKVYFETVGLKCDQNLIESNTLNGDRNPTEPGLGNLDVKGPLSLELQAYIGMLLYGATGSIKTTLLGTGEALGTALTTPTAVIDPWAGTLTITAAAHGQTVGKVLQIAGITTPTALNNTYLRVIKVPGAGSLVCRIPRGISGTFTLGAGTIKPVSTAGTSYAHEMKSGGPLPSFVAETGLPDLPEFFLFNGVKVASMTLNMTPEGYQKISFSLTGSNETPSATSFDSTATDLGKVSYTGFQMGSIVEDVGGADNALASVTGIDVTIENNLDEPAGYVCGSAGKRTCLNAKKLKLSGTITAQFDSMALYTKAINGTKSSLKTSYQVGTGAGTAGNEYLEIKLCELKFGRSTPTVDGDGGVMVKLPVVGFFATNASGAALQITLKNTQPGP